MCGCGKVRVPAFLQKQKQNAMMQAKGMKRRNMINKPQEETTVQVRPTAVVKKPVMNRRQMMHRRQQALRKLNQLKNKRKNMNSPFDHRHYLRY